MKVLKFGGSSVSTPERIRDVTRIVRNAAQRERVVVVVSAFQGVTNQLLECARLAARGDAQYERGFNGLVQRHHTTLASLHRKHIPKSTQAHVKQLLHDLHDVLNGIYLLRESPPRALDLTASFGERLSALIITSYMKRFNRSDCVDSRECIVTDDQFTQAAVLFDETNERTKKLFKKIFSREKVIPIVTGFIGATEDGRTTTIGRNGSDYSAAIIGAALGASAIEIWTDVDGVYSADPRAVPSAFVVPRMTYEEAMELSYFGAKVLHSATIAPAVRENIPVLIKNTMNPTARGTLISKSAAHWEGVAKGITSVENITLLTLQGLSMVGVPGTAERLFRTLANHRVNVILISQASSEHTICFAISNDNAVAARKAISNEFRHELRAKLTTLDERPEQTIIAIVGEGMKGTPGVAGKVFEALGRNNININAIAQGASERNISFVINSTQTVRTLNVVHQAFFEKRKRLSLVIVGIGNIGTALLRQIQRQRPFLFNQGFDVRVLGVANSQRFTLNSDGLNIERWQHELQQSQYRFDPIELAEHVARLEITNVALVDCTASSDIVDAYPKFIEANMHIVTPNKKANVLPWKEYNEFKELLRRRQKYFLYEANVGAGLPIISTLHDLIASGDTIVKIEGILSGTLSYLFNNYDGSTAFSGLVRSARVRGYTEPDPRDDLSGQDVARKLLILARQLGKRMDLVDIHAENLVPPSLRKGKFSNMFFKKYSKYDRAMKQRIKAARSKGTVLRYVGTLTDRTATARLQEVPMNHPLASIQGSDNIIAFTTHRYAHTPLVVQGPGAGADVTAMGVFSDILKLLHYLPF
ncbi:MAG: bifunctional aspartate kinase/homoserine dehydrogenase I [Ignavibacteria bacterium]|nr:bifunctional aspartate kinase/homoserine dehydrogenase I [Ignavibacteria bacterium]